MEAATTRKKTFFTFVEGDMELRLKARKKV